MIISARLSRCLQSLGRSSAALRSPERPGVDHCRFGIGNHGEWRFAEHPRCSLVVRGVPCVFFGDERYPPAHRRERVPDPGGCCLQHPTPCPCRQNGRCRAFQPPLPGDTPAQIAAAQSAAVSQLALQIARSVAR